ncbi:MAG: hypothetical protein WBB67_15045 [bacterium]
MKLTKRKAPRFQRDTEFYNQIIDLSKIRDNHYLLVELNAKDIHPQRGKRDKSE